MPEDITGEMRRVIVKAVQMEVQFTVPTLEGVMKGDAGDYLCIGARGEWWPIKGKVDYSRLAPTDDGLR